MTATPTQTPAHPSTPVAVPGRRPVPGGGGRGGGFVQSVDPRDRARLEEAPVSLRRVLALFSPHRSRIAVVTAIIVATSIVGLAQPFLVREVVDVAIPQQDVRLLLLAVGAILTFALENDLVDGIDLDVVGIILMAAGAIGLFMFAAVWGRRDRVVDRTVVERGPVVERRVYE